MSKKRKKPKEKIEIESKKPKRKKIEKYKNLNLNTKLIIGLLFIALAFGLYAQCLQYGYVLDDKIVLSGNTFTKKGFAGITELFSTDSFQGYFGEQKDLVQGGRYRPLSLVTFAIEHEFLGLNSSVSHIINVILYGLCAFISFISLRLLFKEKTEGIHLIYSISFLSALLFLVHPIHTEAVANIKGRDEIMSCIFSLLAMHQAIKYFDSGKTFNLIGMSLLFILGLFSKENTITFLAVIPLSIMLFRNNGSHSKKQSALFLSIKQLFATLLNKKNLIIIAALFISSFIYLLIRFKVMGFFMNSNPSTDIMNNPFYGLNGSERLATIMYTLFVYLKLSFVPIELTHDYYPYHIPVSKFSDLIVIFSVILNIFLAGLMVFCLNKNRWVSFGIAFYFICLSIVSNIVVDVGTFMNERFIFTASLGLCVLFVAIITAFIQKINKAKKIWLPIAILAPILILYSFKTIDRVPAWQNELSLNTAAIKISKNSARSNSFMATALFNTYKETTDNTEKKRLLKEAKPFAEKAVEIYPMYLNGHLMRAGIAAEQFKLGGSSQDLFASFESIMRKRPDVNYLTTYLKYLNGSSRVSSSELLNFYYNSVDQVLHRQERNYPWAVHFLKIGLEFSPNDKRIKKGLFDALTALGRTNEANVYR